MTKIVVIDESDLVEIIRKEFIEVGIDLLSKNEDRRVSEIMTKKEIAVYLRCDISKINRFMKKDLPYFMFGSTPRFRKSHIDDWLNTRLVNKK